MNLGLKNVDHRYFVWYVVVMVRMRVELSFPLMVLITSCSRDLLLLHMSTVVVVVIWILTISVCFTILLWMIEWIHKV